MGNPSQPSVFTGAMLARGNPSQQIVRPMNEPYVNVKACGAVGDGVTDDTAAIKGAIALATALGIGVFFPNGIYQISAALTPTALHYAGVPDVSTIRQTSVDTAIFRMDAGCSSRDFFGLEFDAQADGVSAFYMAGDEVYWSYCAWTQCEFRKNLKYGIHCNLIFAQIENCRFGYLGNYNASAIFVPIYSHGHQVDPSMWSNINYVKCTYFFGSAGGNAAVDLYTGARWDFVSCDFESLKTPAVYALGIYGMSFTCCWFELGKAEGSGADYVVLGGMDDVQGTTPIVFDKCWFSLSTSTDIDHICALGASSNVVFQGCSGNYGTGYLSKKAGIYDDGVLSCKNNHAVGYIGDLNLLGYVGHGDLQFGGFLFGVIRTFENADATPSIKDGRTFKTNNSGATIVTMFDDGAVGQEILVMVDGNTTIDFTGTNLKGNGGANFTGPGLLNGIYDGTNWQCIVQGQ